MFILQLRLEVAVCHREESNDELIQITSKLFPCQMYRQSYPSFWEQYYQSNKTFSPCECAKNKDK